MLLDITCDFNDGLCQYFTTSTSKEELIWTVKTAEELDNEGINGPETDVDGSESGKFVFVTGFVGDEDPAVVTKLIGPITDGSQLTGCLYFDYNLGVSGNQLINLKMFFLFENWWCLFILFRVLTVYSTLKV